jgi:aryl-alcohol dehydrogenase-like predicted oxidoreductase
VTPCIKWCRLRLSMLRDVQKKREDLPPVIPAIQTVERRSGPPVMGLGCVGLGAMGRRGVRLIEYALDIGVRLFDTADAYGNGSSEVLLGRALRKRRQEAFVATKGGFLFKERSPLVSVAGPLARSPIAGRARAVVPRRTGRASPTTAYSGQDLRPAYLRAALDASLRRLGTDYVDLYQLHAPRTFDDDVLGFAEDMRAVGKIRGFGIGVEDLGSAESWINTGSLSHILVPFGILDPEARDGTIPVAAARSICVLVRGVYAAGFIARADGPDAAALRPGQPEVLTSLTALARSAGVSPLQIATWFVTTRPEISGMLIGTSSPAHLREAVRYLHTKPDQEIVRYAELQLEKWRVPSEAHRVLEGTE